MTQKQTPKKGRPTPRQRRRRPAPPSRAETTEKQRHGLGLVVCIVSAFLHLAVVGWVIVLTGGETSSTVAALALAPFVTAVLVPYARTHGWHRWLVLLGLSVSTYSDLLLPTLLIAETWILYRLWIIEGEVKAPSLPVRRVTPSSGHSAGRTVG